MLCSVPRYHTESIGTVLLDSEQVDTAVRELFSSSGVTNGHFGLGVQVLLLI